ncbi:MAG TPA: hypothetical protein H9881_03965 [Candidatus Stackebrandtia excrementipullorum]|nr:hypothetical protein [Candidatus Stackebrandtia excrementipullorum]
MSKRARAALVAGIAAAALTFTPVSPAAAAIPPCPPNHSCMLDYYDSPDMTKQIGYSYLPCTGGWTHVGQTSSWALLHSNPCR